MVTLNRGIRDGFDWPLFVMVATIALLGVVNLYSATSAMPLQLRDIYIQQIYWLTLGAGVAVLVASIDYRYYERYAWVGYGIGIVLLALVFLLGREVRGSQRWIPIGNFSLQPSELMKIFFIIALAKHLHDDPRTEGRTLKDLIIPGLILSVPMVLILAQPDLGTAMIIAAIFASIMFLTHLKLRSFITLVLSFMVSAPLTWRYLLKDYQRERLTAFLDPDNDILGKGWHAYQAKVAIGSGGLTGKGFLQGTQVQHRFLPDAHSDFPFSVWAEEQGFIGSMLLVILYTGLVLWGLKIASDAKDRFGAVVAVGVSALIFWQTVINLGMVSGLLPVVGITLPLVSYGGSSVLTVMVGIGLLMNVSMRRFHF
jgi:rod shape determining protein RodA